VGRGESEVKEDIRKRVERQSLDRLGHCYICGNTFKNEDACPHSYADQRIAEQSLYAEKLLEGKMK
jgi:hypothetical protein